MVFYQIGAKRFNIIQCLVIRRIQLFQKRLSERTANGNCRREIVRPKGTAGFEY